jgi:hypothetical protein
MLLNETPLPLSNFHSIESSSLAKLAYDSERTILQVEFRDRTVHQYTGVPGTIYQSLCRADSKGAYFNRHIRDRFTHTRVATSV